MRISAIANTGDYVEVVYANDDDINIDAGVITTHTVRIANDAIDHELLEELETLGKQMLDVGRRRRFGVADEFKAEGR
jgi:hypothetical protein